MAESMPRLLVPFNGSAASRRGLDVALQLAGGQKKSRLHAVYVVEVDRRLPLDADLPEASMKGERCLADVEERSRKIKTDCDGDILQARDAGHAIVDEAVELAATAIVMGIPRGETEPQVVNLGKTAAYVLQHAPCDVILVRDGSHA